jgi:hypothetical protein
MPAAYTDLFNTALDDLADFLATVLDLVVVTDPRNVAPPCVVISPCSFEAFNDKVADLTFPVQIITLGPANLDAQRSLLNLASQVLGKGVAVTSGRPTAIEYGNGVYPAYELTVKITTKTSA